MPSPSEELAISPLISGCFAFRHDGSWGMPSLGVKPVSGVCASPGTCSCRIFMCIEQVWWNWGHSGRICALPGPRLSFGSAQAHQIWAHNMGPRDTGHAFVVRSQFQPSPQHEGKTTWHRSQAITLYSSRLKPTLYIQWEDKKKEDWIQLIRQEQTSSWPRRWALWVPWGSCCGYLCSARRVQTYPGGTGEPASLRLTNWFKVEEHSKESKSRISAHLWKQGCCQWTLL